jgi:EAL domain-containing protein (putative c-di-GMP-specific phosphodiesterase class I)
MYAAKRAGAGMLVYDAERERDAQQRLSRADALRTAITAGGIELHYQPLLHLATGRVEAVEALARWRQADGRLASPAEFIALAEETGLMDELTLAVLNLAARDIARLRATIDPALQVAVNVSPTNLLDAAFPDSLAAILSRHQVPASALHLEVTEHLLLADRAATAEVLRALTKLGVGISIDDYGSGYCSLAYLAELPVQQLKLDRMFVAGMADSPRTAAIVSSTIALAHALGLSLVAEGVEDAATIGALRSAGADVLQGYGIARPAPVHELAAAIESVHHLHSGVSSHAASLPC